MNATSAAKAGPHHTPALNDSGVSGAEKIARARAPTPETSFQNGCNKRPEYGEPSFSRQRTRVMVLCERTQSQELIDVVKQQPVEHDSPWPSRSESPSAPCRPRPLPTRTSSSCLATSSCPGNTACPPGKS